MTTEQFVDLVNKKHSLKQLKEIRNLTELCNGDTQIIDILSI